MTAGLPGTGIGGLFYLMLVCWMPCRELYRLCRRRSTLRRWLDIAFYASVTVAIVVTMWGEAWLLSQILTRAATAVGILRPGTGQGYQVLAAVSIVLSFGSLVAVVLAVHVLRAALWLSRRKPALRRMVTGPVAGAAAAAQ
jgi:hypothetical protein